MIRTRVCGVSLMHSTLTFYILTRQTVNQRVFWLQQHTDDMKISRLLFVSALILEIKVQLIESSIHPVVRIQVIPIQPQVSENPFVNAHKMNKTGTIALWSHHTYQRNWNVMVFCYSRTLERKIPWSVWRKHVNLVQLLEKKNTHACCLTYASCSSVWNVMETTEFTKSSHSCSNTDEDIWMKKSCSISKQIWGREPCNFPWKVTEPGESLSPIHKHVRLVWISQAPITNWTLAGKNPFRGVEFEYQL